MLGKQSTSLINYATVFIYSKRTISSAKHIIKGEVIFLQVVELKIKILCPAYRLDVPESAFSMDLWVELFERGRKPIVREDTEICVSLLRRGTPYYESIYDLEVGSAVASDGYKKAEEEGFDALVIDCAADPGLEGAKEYLDIPAVGAMEAAYHIACLLGHRFSIVTPSEGLARVLRRQIGLYGMEGRLASIRVAEVSLKEIKWGTGDEELKKQMIEEAKRAVEEDDADVIIIGGTALSCPPLEIAQAVGRALKPIRVPVLCGGVIATKVAEMFVDLGLVQSKKAFPNPSEAERRL